MSESDDTTPPPMGNPHRTAGRRRARNPEYAAERARLGPYEALARIVIRRRGELGLTQQQLADRMETSHSAVSRIEAGQHRTSVATLERLAQAMGTHLVVGFADDAADVATTGSGSSTRDLVALT